MHVHRFMYRTTFALLLALSGCTTMGRAEATSATVTLRESGRLYVGDSHTGLAGMVRQLKADGATRQTRITVEIPHNIAPETLQSISRQLASAGFRRIIFIKPRRAVSEVGEDPFVSRFRDARGDP